MTSNADAIVAIDGVVTTRVDAKVSVFDRGFLYGDAVFEVFRTYHGVPFALDEHVARLRRSADLVHITVPIDDAAITAEIERILDVARAARPSADFYARLMLSRGSGPMGLDPALATSPLRVLIVAPLAPPSRDVYARGIGVVRIATTRAVDGTPAVGAKVTSWLASILALREATSRGASEALIVDAHGDVIEGASSNVFVVDGGTLVTPDERSGILAGITRAHVVAAAKDRGIAVRFASLAPHDLENADEAFITSSIREIVPVASIDGRVVGAGEPGPITRALHRDVRARAGAADLAMPWE